jgi:hypothetical protein
VVSGASGQLLHGKVTKSSTGPMIQLWRFLFGLVLSMGSMVFLILLWINMLLPTPTPTHVEVVTNWCWHVKHIFFVFHNSKTNIESSFFKMYFYSWHMQLSCVCILYHIMEIVHWCIICRWPHVDYHLKRRTELSSCTYCPFVLHSSKN